MSNADIFIDKYKQLEEAVRFSYNLKETDSISRYLTEKSRFRDHKEEIKYCQEVRNLLSHKKKIDGSFPVEPSTQMIAFIDRLIEKIRNRPRCRDIQTPIENVSWKPLEGSVKAAVRIMRERRYTHIPILENGVVVGVFDENSVFNYMANGEKASLDDALTFAQIKEYIKLTGRELEDFIFFRSGEYVDALEDEFEKSTRRGRRIGVAFLTQSGDPREHLQGIITPWDIIAAKG